MGHFGTKSPAAATTNKIDRDTMTPSSTLDLFMLTFNCAKNLINVPVFSSHLHAALQQNATSLPDLVVLSLQEVAPLSYAFIGNYFLNPYYARYENALNLASARLLATSPSGSEEVLRDGRQAPPYTLVRAKNVGMTSILLFARDPTAVGPIEEAECGFGAADMGNKGAVGFRVTWASPNHGSSPTELTFVAAHLAAMEWNLKKRNANWRSIVSGLTFSNPRFVLPGVFPPSRESSPMPDRSGAGDTAPTTPVLSTSPTFSSVDSSEAEEEANQPLLSIENEASHFSPHLSPEQAQTLQSTSIFKPTSHLFLAGDLNYRISSSTPLPSAPFPSFDPSSDHYFPSFLPRDQLTQERLAGRAFHGMEEAPITFGPTYKFDILPKIAANKAVNSAAVASGATVNGVPEVPWRFAPHRWPGWCDRVLFLEPPSASTQKKERNKMDVKAYDAFPVLETSDHRPVFLRVKVPLLSAQEMLARSARAEEEQEEEEGNEDGTKFLDPRVKMPVPVDVDAWERRAAARKKEVVVGWSAFLWSTREGAMVLSATLMVLVGGWWLLRAW